MRNYTRLACGLAGLALIVMAGCKDKDKENGGTGSVPAGDKYLVGEYGSMTGSESAFGQSTDDGIQLAVEEINKAGGINGKQVEIVGPEDTESNSQKAEIAVKRLIEKNVVAVLGEVASSRSLAGAAVCQQAQIPMITPSSTNPKVTESGDYIFRVCFIDPYQAGFIAKFARESLKANTASIFYAQDQTYAVGIRDEFTKSFAAKGGKILSEASYATGDKDFSAQLTKLKSGNPDVLVVAGYYTEGGTIAKQARDLGLKMPLIGGDGWSDVKFHEFAGNNVSNVYFSDHASMDAKTPAIEKYVAAYKAKFNKQPSSLSALGYDSMMVLADALKRSGGQTGSQLRSAIAGTKEFPGVTGSITINSQRNADKGAVIIEVSGGQFKFKEAYDKP